MSNVLLTPPEEKKVCVWGGGGGEVEGGNHDILFKAHTGEPTRQTLVTLLPITARN